jgi:hemolysin activation/secretion protein
VADAAEQVPSSVNPAIIEKHFEQPEEPTPPSNLQTPVLPLETPPPPSKEMREQMAKVSFTLKSVVIDGATVYSIDELKPAWQDLIGKKISPLDSEAIAQRITAIYHRDDYFLSQAVVPQQEIKNGVLTVRVVEGFISNVIFVGDVQHSILRDSLAPFADRIKRLHPVQTADVERTLLLINDLPGVTAQGTLRPSPNEFGGAELVVAMTNKSVDGVYSLDNRGTKFVGPWEHTALFAANSAFGMYERTQLRINTTSPTTAMRYWDLQHDEPLDGNGTRLLLDVSQSQTAPGNTLRPLGIIGDSDYFQAKITNPLIRSRRQTLIARAMFDMRNTGTDIFHATPYSEDRLRVARAGGSYNIFDGWYGNNLVDAQVSHGFNVLGATSSGSERSNPIGRSNFTKLNFDLSRTQSLPKNFSVFAAFSGQASSDPLLAAEQFTLGGAGFGGAYDPGELSGDEGMAGKLELRYDRTLNQPLFNGYELFGYYDIGRVWLENAAIHANDKKSLASTGFGVRSFFTDNLSTTLELGIPMTKPVTNEGFEDKGPRIFFSATAKF